MRNLLLCSLVLFTSLNSLAGVVHHHLQVQLTPALHQIVGTDEISNLPGKVFEVSLNKSLTLTTLNAQILNKSEIQGESVSIYLLQLNPQDSTLKIEFSGLIHDPVTQDSSTGLIELRGASLFGSSYWYPHVMDSSLTFELEASGPPNWQFVSQGLSLGQSWQSLSPQEEIYLIGAEFKRFDLLSQGKKYSVFLRNESQQADPQLAQKFLDLTPGYIEHYSKVLAPFPYPQFSVVENFWETGFGMPGFTLLGPSVIRLPFIFTSSYPHEILHNWWGNSVFVDYDNGNWSEGLTTYMADHWQQEMVHQDSEYRLSTLLNYASYVGAGVGSGADFPVRQFKGRHNQSSQAVGYGKSMMFFHMLKVQFSSLYSLVYLKENKQLIF